MNTTIIDGQQYALIPLTQGKFAIADIDMFEHLNQWKWIYCAGGYAGRITAPGRESVLMHRVICQTQDGLVTDHINGNPLDNRRSNLRSATHAENMRNQGPHKHNKLGVKGVRYARRSFHAYIKFQGKQINLGHYPTLEQAQTAYDSAAKRIHGEFALPNHELFKVRKRLEEP